MSFKTKTEPYGIADGTNIVVLDTQGGETAQNVEAVGEDGSVVANTVTETLLNPSATLALKAAITKALGDWKLGNVSTSDTKKFALEKIEITTTAGAAASIRISGKQVQSDATTGCTYSVPAFTLTTKHHAQILFSAFSLSGTGCHLTSATYTIEGTINLVTKDGSVIGFDIVQGKIEVSVSIKQCGSAAPELTAGDGFQVTSPLAETNPDADYPTFTATLTKYLAKDAPAAQTTQNTQGA